MKSSLANRGRPFEDLLNLAHSRYQADGQACVHKVPTEFLPLRDRRGQITGYLDIINDLFAGRDKPHGAE